MKFACAYIFADIIGWIMHLAIFRWHYLLNLSCTFLRYHWLNYACSYILRTSLVKFSLQLYCLCYYRLHFANSNISFDSIGWILPVVWYPFLCFDHNDDIKWRNSRPFYTVTILKRQTPRVIDSNFIIWYNICPR